MDTKKIEERAYQIYIRRTQSPIWEFGKLGTAVGDYYQAEKELKDELRNTDSSSTSI